MYIEHPNPSKNKKGKICGKKYSETNIEYETNKHIPNLSGLMLYIGLLLELEKKL